MVQTKVVFGIPYSNLILIYTWTADLEGFFIKFMPSHKLIILKSLYTL